MVWSQASKDEFARLPDNMIFKIQQLHTIRAIPKISFKRTVKIRRRATVFTVSEMFHPAGVICAETLRLDSRTLDQSEHMRHQCQELGEVLQDVDSKKVTQALIL